MSNKAIAEIWWDSTDDDCSWKLNMLVEIAAPMNTKIPVIEYNPDIATNVLSVAEVFSDDVLIDIHESGISLDTIMQIVRRVELLHGFN